MSKSIPKPISRLHITAPARLHLGFLDLNGGLGRRFGSLGLALEQPAYAVSFRPASRLRAQGPDAARAEHYVHILHEKLGWPTGVEITIEHALPAHSGLGSGTQLALAIGTGLARLFDITITTASLAAVLDRGARSGIGIGAFEQGGFIVDGGCQEQTHSARPPPIISRLDFPAAWRVVLMFDREQQGFSGGTERRAFAELPSFPAPQAADLCRLVLMRALPALAEANFIAFGEAISALQNTIGDYFAPVQGGRFTSPKVATLLAELAQQGRVGLGQSSWGPTGFALCPSADDAAQLQAQLSAEQKPGSALHFAIAVPRNRPALIEAHTDTLQYTVG
jgi:beta-RFAP synthase